MSVKSENRVHGNTIKKAYVTSDTFLGFKDISTRLTKPGFMCAISPLRCGNERVGVFGCSSLHLPLGEIAQLVKPEEYKSEPELKIE